MQIRSAEDAADVAELAAAERAVARHAGTPEDVEGVAEAGKARRGEDRLEGWRRRHHTDRNSLLRFFDRAAEAPPVGPSDDLQAVPITSNGQAH